MADPAPRVRAPGVPGGQQGHGLNPRPCEGNDPRTVRSKTRSRRWVRRPTTVRGFRLDVFDTGTGPWRSVHERTVTAKATRFAGPLHPVADEGFFQLSLAGAATPAGPPWGAVRARVPDHLGRLEPVGGGWEGEPGTLHLGPYPYDDICVMICGRVALTGNGGGRREFTGGDVFFIPRGFGGAWETLEPSSTFLFDTHGSKGRSRAGGAWGGGGFPVGSGGLWRTVAADSLALASELRRGCATERGEHAVEPAD
ncbi:cupin domain-containing protein [Nonomuraea sp. NPDC000554]|uniref:cupin domain-containing protein n=1 Tax=Nonomuraea sp. NPDC000554 TaxID=3154259 RepID=UPI003320E230